MSLVVTAVVEEGLELTCMTVCFSGSRRRHKTKLVVRRLQKNLVQTATGSRYRLIGPMHIASTHSPC